MLHLGLKEPSPNGWQYEWIKDVQGVKANRYDASKNTNEIYMQHIALYRIMHKTISPNLETENYTETLPKNDNT